MTNSVTPFDFDVHEEYNYEAHRSQFKLATNHFIWSTPSRMIEQSRINSDEITAKVMGFDVAELRA